MQEVAGHLTAVCPDLPFKLSAFLLCIIFSSSYFPLKQRQGQSGLWDGGIREPSRDPAVEPGPSQEKRGTWNLEAQVDGGLAGETIMAAGFLGMLPLALLQAWQGTPECTELSVEPSSSQPRTLAGWAVGVQGEGLSTFFASPPPELLQPSCAGGPGVLSE